MIVYVQNIIPKYLDQKLRMNLCVHFKANWLLFFMVECFDLMINILILLHYSWFEPQLPFLNINKVTLRSLSLSLSLTLFCPHLMVYLRGQCSTLFKPVSVTCNLMTVTIHVIVPVMIIINQPISQSVMK